MIFPPLHPIFVNFTAALIPASFAFDLLGAWLNRDGLRQTAWWTLLLAAIISPFTALFGWIWFWTGSHGGGTLISIHQWLGTAVAAVVVALAVWRGLRFTRAGNRPGWAYAIAAGILLGGLMVQGDIGGAMTFGQGIVVSGSSHQHGGGGGGGGGHAGHEHGEHEHGGENRGRGHHEGEATRTSHQEGETRARHEDGKHGGAVDGGDDHAHHEH